MHKLRQLFSRNHFAQMVRNVTLNLLNYRVILMQRMEYEADEPKRPSMHLIQRSGCSPVPLPLPFMQQFVGRQSVLMQNVMDHLEKSMIECLQRARG